MRRLLLQSKTTRLSRSAGGHGRHHHNDERYSQRALAWTATCAVTISAGAVVYIPHLSSSVGYNYHGEGNFAVNGTSYCEALPDDDSDDADETSSQEWDPSSASSSAETESVSDFRKRRLTVMLPPDGLKEKREAPGDLQTSTDDERAREMQERLEQEKKVFHPREDTATTIITDGVPRSIARVMHAIEIEDMLPPSLRKMKTKQVDEHLLHNDIRSLHRPIHYQLAFLEAKVGAFSCHGIEPQVYVVNDWKTIFGNLMEATFVTIIKRKINQDRGHFTFSYGNSPRTALFGAYDGHGPKGELISQYAMNVVHERLHKHPDYKTDLRKAFHETFLHVDNDLRKLSDIHGIDGGSTGCVILLRDKHMCVANLGDSRAVLGRKTRPSTPNLNDATQSLPTDPLSRMVAIELTKDQTASCPIEKDRIVKSGGYVTERHGGKSRIWADPAYTKVGLAMTRCFGDHELKQLGVIADPVVTEHVLTDEDEFIIVATDGVWEFIDSQEAVRIVGTYFANGQSASEACLGLIQAAIKKWREAEGDYRDDITAIVVRVKDLWDEEDKSKHDKDTE